VAPARRPALALTAESFPGQPLRDTAVSHALLRRVATGEAPETLRLYVPDEVTLFSVLDKRRPGFSEAREAAAALGCPSVLRLAGGHAALFHRQCLAFAWAMPATRAPREITARFETISALVARALDRLGVDARRGEVPGEYCPGDYSVNAGGRIKLMGVGQRVIRGGAHLGGVIVVGDSARVREILTPVYAALGLDWDPRTAGAVADAVPGIGLDDMRAALLAEVAATRTLETAPIDPDTLELAATLEPRHTPHGHPRVSECPDAPGRIS